MNGNYFAQKDKTVSSVCFRVRIKKLRAYTQCQSIYSHSVSLAVCLTVCESNTIYY